MTRTDAQELASVRSHEGAHPDHAARMPRFWWHFVQMVLAMMVGMAVLGVPFRAILASLGYTWHEAVTRLPEVVCVVMTFDMAVGMVAWMRFRGHGWRTSAEMTAAMYAATAVALAGYRLHVVSTDSLIGAMHVLMLPAMLLVMLARRDRYASSHR